MRPSMGSVGDAYDNAMCESFFATLECELLDRRKFRTHDPNLGNREIAAFAQCCRFHSSAAQDALMRRTTGPLGIVETEIQRTGANCAETERRQETVTAR